MPPPVVSPEFDRGLRFGIVLGLALWIVGIAAVVYIVSVLV